MDYYLGIDGGGTKTAALIVDGVGCERGRGLGGPCNIASHKDEALAHSVRDAVSTACLAAGLEPREARFRAVCAGVAGYSAPSRRAPFLQILRREVRAERYHLEGDFVIAYWGATEGEPGVILIAGTGAVAYGRNAEGKTHQEDGLGYLLGDKGSGFSVGKRALDFAVKYLRGTLWVQAGVTERHPHPDATEYVEAILRHVGAQDLNEVVQWLYPDFQTARVAELAPIVGALADQSNALALLDIRAATRDLRNTVSRTLLHLSMPKDSSVYPLGGLWNISPFFRALFEEPHPVVFIDAERKPLDPQPDRRLNLVAPKHDAVFGAALLARTHS